MKKRKDYIVPTKTEVAEFFGVTDAAIRKWIDDGMPTEQKGGFDLSKVADWRYKGLMQKFDDLNSQDRWSDEYRKNKALLEEIKLKEKQGQLISRQEIKKSFINMMFNIKTSFLLIPKTVSHQLEGLGAREIEAILKTKIEEICMLFENGKAFKDATEDKDASQ